MKEGADAPTTYTNTSDVSRTFVRRSVKPMSERKRTAVRAAPRRNAGKAEVVDRGKLWRRVSVSFDEHAHDMIRFHLSGRPARGGHWTWSRWMDKSNVCHSP